MRRMLSVLFIAVMANACQKPAHTDLDHENAVLAGEFITKNYSGDAIQLYLRELRQNTQHKNYNNPAIDSQELVSMLKIFQAVYDLNTPETKYIFNTRKLHSKHCFSTGSIILKVDTAQPEIKQLAAGKIPTGNPDLDKILLKYQFDSVRLAYGYPQITWLTINTAQRLNTIPIVNELKQVPSILIAEQNGGCIDGDDIAFSKEQGGVKITFSEGGGDCPSGCTFRKYWDFRVKNGIATYLGTR
ncbi:MAG: hypothetical protein J7599_15390 [Niabella sp.]|nr:hypothetical protein [Niabella sp.]